VVNTNNIPSGFIGLAYPLYNAYIPFILATRGARLGDGSTYTTYRNAMIIGVLGVPGAALGGFLVEIKGFGRRGTLGLATACTGAFLYASTTASSSDALLGWNCAYSFTSSIMVCFPFELLASSFSAIFLVFKSDQSS
jgi:hypothetical protein